MSDALFLRLLSFEDKDKALAETIAATHKGIALNPVIYAVDPNSFGQVPGSPFAYWVSEGIRRIFTELPPFESEGRTVKQGLVTADDFRFVRIWWEASIESVCPPTSHPERFSGPYCILGGYRWFPFAKGGYYSPYYADLHLVVNWERDGAAIRSFIDPNTGRTFSRPQNTDFYFRPSLTWPRRTTSGISIRPQPAGSIFSDKSPSAFEDDSLAWLGLLQSSTFSALISIQLAAADAAARSYEVGLIQKTPVPALSTKEGEHLAEVAQRSMDLKRRLDTSNETSHVYHLPVLLQTSGDTLEERADSWQQRINDTEKQLNDHQHEIDDIAFRLYGIEDVDRQAIESMLVSNQSSADSEESEGERAEETEAESPTADHRQLTTDLLSYFVGCAFGRWDLRFATGERVAPELPNPFAPLPVCAPGALTGEDGLPLHEAPEGYPLRVDWNGILVDDPDHEDDLIRRIRDVLELLWQKRAEAIEHEACDLLGVKTLRDYFRKPGNDGFWMQHVKRYSKSRRKAPIYWLLQSSKKNYALWLYYHRLDKDILFKALVNYVEPKLRLEETGLEQLRSQRAAGATGREARQLDRQIEKQEALLSELHDFHDKLRRAAELRLEHDLNDGVVLNIAPLWELVPWTEAKKYWHELLAGKYEWSSIGKQLRERKLVKAE